MTCKMETRKGNPDGKNILLLPLTLLGILLLRAGVKSNPGIHININTHTTGTYISQDNTYQKKIHITGTCISQGYVYHMDIFITGTYLSHEHTYHRYTLSHQHTYYRDTYITGKYISQGNTYIIRTHL